MSNNTKIQNILNDEKVQKILNNKNINKSRKFEQLYELDLTISQISKITYSVYSFVYTIIDNYTNSEHRKNKENKENWKNLFIKEYFENKLNIGDISKKYNKNYSYVWSCVNNERKKLNK